MYDTTIEVEPTERVYLPNLPSQLALFAQDNFKIEEIIRLY